MPITTDAVAIKSEAVKKFTSSENFNRFNKKNLIFAEFESEEGDKLYLFYPNSWVPIEGLDPDEFIWISVDDEDDFSVEGVWSNFPFNLDVNCQMSWIVNDESRVEDLIKSFDYSILLDVRLKEICTKFIESKMLFEDWCDSENGLVDEFVEIMNAHGIDPATFEELANSTHEMNFLKETNFQTSLSTAKTFIGKFCPNLIQLVKFSENILDITSDLRELENFACSTYTTENYELIEYLVNEEIESIEFEDLINYPSIAVCGFSGSGSNGWDGELDKLNAGVKPIRIGFVTNFV